MASLRETLNQAGISEAARTRLEQWGNTLPPAQCWQKVLDEILTPDIPFELHQQLHAHIFGNDAWDTAAQGPAPVWLPSHSQKENTHIHTWMQELGLADYPDFHRWSVCNRTQFWKKVIAALQIRFQKKSQELLNTQHGLETPQWLPGSRLNIVESCFQADQETTAIVWQREGGKLQRWSYAYLQKMTNRVANGLRTLGFKPGDAIAMDTVMTAEAVAAYLGIIKAGCQVVSIADSLAAAEVRKRLDITGAKAIFTQDVILRQGKSIPLYTKILDAGPEKVIVLPAAENIQVKLRKEDTTWSNFLSNDDAFTAEPCTPKTTCNVLFSSGTTGTPKAIPWTHLTPIKCASDGYFHQDIHAGEVVAWPTNIGWMMGPWLIFAALLNKATIALYYGVPTGRGFGKFVQEARVNMLGVVPSMVKQWRESGCMDGLDWTSLKCYSSTGEASNAVDYHWLMSRVPGYRPVIEYCGGTEIGGGYATGTLWQPAVPAAFSTPALGLDLLVLNEQAQATRSDEVYLLPPSVGLSLSLLNKDHHKAYFSDAPACPKEARGVLGTPVADQVKDFGHAPVLRQHGDEVEVLPAGYMRALGRADDTMNLGGIKVGSAEIERVAERVEAVHETAAIAVTQPGGGPARLIIFTVLKANKKTDPDKLRKLFQQQIRQHLNPLFKVHEVVLTDALPRTASNKVMRRVLRDNYQRENKP